MLKRVLFIAGLLLLGGTIAAQDVSVTAINSPASGCGLTSTENVVIKIFNFGTDLSGMPFNVSYTINGGAPVVESATFPSFLTNSTVTYTFTAKANLSTAGSYTFTASTALAGDVNPSNDTYSGYVVVNSSPSVGGTVSGAANVCYNSNAGVLTLAGQTGNILNWEYSTDGGVTWITISNTTANQSYTNLTVQTSYRARVQNSSCAVATSSVATMTINPTTVAGTTTGSTTQCSGSNGGSIVLGGQTGTVQNWQFSTDGGATWTNIANTTLTQNYLNLVTTTAYRAVVKSGACSSLNSSSSTITINPVTVGGTVAPATGTVCSGANTGTLTLSGQTGTVQRWEFSTDGGVTWTNIANTLATQTYSNIVSTRIFRALVKSGVCSSLYSATATVTVAPATVAGSVATSTTVCSGANSGTLTLSGQTGTILNWESSINNGVTWTSIANTTTTQTYSNLATTTLYHAVVQNGTCPSASSTAATITVNNPSVGGSVSGSTTVCASGNSGAMNLSGQTGTVQSWESSSDGGVTWSSIVNTTSSQNFSNLSTSTMYHALVKSGVCPVATSSSSTITVNPVTVGGSVSSNTTVCNGNNSGTLNLVGNTGSVLDWEVSNDGGLTWIAITNTTTAQGYNNITSSAFYRAQVKSGVCAAQYSGPAIISLDPKAVGGNTYGTSTVCNGSNNGAITLVGHSQSVAQWESSVDNGTTWTAITNTTTTQNYTNLTQTTWYHAIVSSGVCPNDTSSITILSVDSNSVGGMLASNATVCSGSNSGTVTLSGQTGNVQNWYISTDGGISWLVVGNTTTSYAYSNLTQTTLLKADVKYGVCPSAQSAADTITVNPKANAGTMSSSSNVCQAGNTGVLSLSTYTGTIMSWESSIDNGATWSSLSNTANTYTYTNVAQTTLYRAIVSSGVCLDDTSNIVTITVDSTSVGGTLNVSDTVCASANSGTLTISGQTGSVQNWYISTDGGNTWLTSANTGATYPYNNLTQTTVIKADVKSGVCPSSSTSLVTITVDPVAVGGMLSSSATVCQTSNNGNITLSGYTGNISGWQSSIDNGATWTAITNTTTTQSYTNLSQTTLYQALIAGGACPNDSSSTVTIKVDSATVSGVLNTSDTVCASGNTGTITISGQTGNVQSWYISTDGGNTWLTTANTGSTYAYNNLAQTTEIKADVKNGVCPSTTTLPVIITVDQVAVGGMLSSNATVCQISNSGNITLSGYTGNISGWQTSIDNGTTWTPVTNTTTVNAYNNLQQTTLYQAIISSGVCPNDSSSIVTIKVDSASVGGVISKDTSFCMGPNSDTLFLNGQKGNVLNWSISTDGGNNWFANTNTGTFQHFTNITTNTWYTATVKNGVCPAVSSDTAIVTIIPSSQAGALSGPMKVCDLYNADTIYYANGVGVITNWVTSNNGGSTYTATGTTLNNLPFDSLTSPTIFGVIVQNMNCPADTGFYQVGINPKPNLVASGDTVCFGSPITFTNTSTISSGIIASYNWDLADGTYSSLHNPIHTYADTGNYVSTLSAISNLGCVDTIRVPSRVNSVPSSKITLSSPTANICKGDTITLSGMNLPGFSYIWSDGDTAWSTNIDTSGVFVLTVTDSITGCWSKDSVQTYLYYPPVISASNDTTIPTAGTATLNVNVTPSVGSYTYNWLPAPDYGGTTPMPVVTPSVTTEYVITVTNEYGCSAKDSVKVTLDLNLVELFIPNLITPNGDGFNDKFEIKKLELFKQNSLAIVNRSGQLIYAMENYDNNWEGTYQGNVVQDGSYYYILKISSGNISKEFKGPINVLRSK
ncbi:MAG: T9SS type B sorting domain-containing protein [Bacteroidia bacterium]